MIDFVSRRFLITSDTTMCTNGLSNTCRKPMLLLKHACTIRVRQLAEPERSRRARGRQQHHEYQDPPQSPTRWVQHRPMRCHRPGGAKGRRARGPLAPTPSGSSLWTWQSRGTSAYGLRRGVLERGGSGSDAGGRQGKRRRWRRTSASRNGGGRRRGGRS
jgi:hypothetical protein